MKYNTIQLLQHVHGPPVFCGS